MESGDIKEHNGMYRGPKIGSSYNAAGLGTFEKRFGCYLVANKCAVFAELDGNMPVGWPPELKQSASAAAKAQRQETLDRLEGMFEIKNK